MTPVMTPGDAPDVAAMAARLTKAMQSALRMASEERQGLYRVRDRGIVRKALRERGLGHGDYCYLTPLGLGVRAHLLAQGDAK